MHPQQSLNIRPHSVAVVVTTAQCQDNLPVLCSYLTYQSMHKLTCHTLLNNNNNEQERLLACGAAVVARLRGRVTSELGFTCSGGIAHNKAMAKLASGLHKPNQQTVVPSEQVAGLLKDLPLSRIRGLGGKLGDQVCALYLLLVLVLSIVSAAAVTSTVNVLVTGMQQLCSYGRQLTAQCQYRTVAYYRQ
jgi:impB/mucB/samB family